MAPARRIMSDYQVRLCRHDFVLSMAFGDRVVASLVCSGYPMKQRKDRETEIHMVPATLEGRSLSISLFPQETHLTIRISDLIIRYQTRIGLLLSDSRLCSSLVRDPRPSCSRVCPVARLTTLMHLMARLLAATPLHQIPSLHL